MTKSSAAQKRRIVAKAGQHQAEIVRLIQSVARSYGVATVWSDWMEMCAVALAKIDRARADAREERYLNIVKRYETPELALLVQAFGHLTLEWEARCKTGELGDVLGSTFMMLDLGSGHTGQFFTPYEVSRMMSAMLMPQGEALVAEVKRKGFLRLLEPAAGAGGMAIASAHALKDAGCNYQRDLHVTAIDIDARCVHMTFVQLALLHIPAVVIHGNALTGESWDQWSTPAHFLGDWGRRLFDRAQSACPAQSVSERVFAATAEAVPKDLEIVMPATQMMLF